MSDLNPTGERCARCGQVARGSARINQDRFCHGDDQPTCYMLESWERSGVTLDGIPVAGRTVDEFVRRRR